MFGLQIVTKNKLAQIKIDARNEAISDLVALLKKKDKIYVEPVTIVGNRLTITDCIFFGKMIVQPDGSITTPPPKDMVENEIRHPGKV